MLENRPEKNPVACKLLWLIKRVVARAPVRGYFTALWEEERGCVSEQVHNTVLGSQGEAREDDEMQSAAVLGCTCRHQGGSQYNTEIGELSPDTLWWLFLEKSLMFRHSHLSLR